MLTFSRFLFGILKLYLIKTYLYKIDPLEVYLSNPSLTYLLLTFVLFPTRLYLLLSGFCDILISSAKLAGLEVPEDYDSPFLARNILDLWPRFHRTLTFFYRDYLFMPSFLWLGRRIKTAIAFVIAIMITFFFMGQWHTNPKTYNVWTIFGMLHGLAVIIFIIYRDFLKNRLTKEKLEKYNNNKIIHLLAIFVTQTFGVLLCYYIATRYQNLRNY